MIPGFIVRLGLILILGMISFFTHWSSASSLDSSEYTKIYCGSGMNFECVKFKQINFDKKYVVVVPIKNSKNLESQKLRLDHKGAGIFASSYLVVEQYKKYGIEYQNRAYFQFDEHDKSKVLVVKYKVKIFSGTPVQNTILSSAWFQ